MVSRFRMMPRAGRLEAVLVAVLAAPLLMLLLFASAWDEVGRMARLPAFWIFLAAMASAWPVWRWTQARLARTALLTLDGEGMTMQSGLPAFWRSAVGADWQCRWAEIRSVVVIEGLGMVRITSSGRGMPIVLRIVDWVREGMPAESAHGMKESDLWRALDAAGVFRHIASPQHEALTFNLWKHPGTRAMLVLAACLLAYGVIDSLLRREAWAGYDWRYYLPHLVVGALAFAVALYALMRVSSPRILLSIGVVMATLVGFGAVVASYSGLIRLNQVAAGPLETKAYRRSAACDALLPLETGLPEIAYSGLARDYWCSQPASATHEVPVRKGLFGLYQVDLTAHTEAIRRFRGSR